MNLNELRKYSLKYLQLLGYTYGSTISIKDDVGKIISFQWISVDDKKYNFLKIFKPRNWEKYYDHSILVNIQKEGYEDSRYNFEISQALFYLNSKKINSNIKLIKPNLGFRLAKEDSCTSYVYYNEYLIGDITNITTGFEQRLIATFYPIPLLFKDDIDKLNYNTEQTIYENLIISKHWFEDAYAEEVFVMHFHDKLSSQCPKVLDKLKQKIGIWDSLIKNVS